MLYKDLDKDFISDTFRIKWNAIERKAEPFNEDVIIDFKPSLPNPITISTPLIPISFYNEKEISRILNDPTGTFDEVKKALKLDQLNPKRFDYAKVNLYQIGSKPRYEYRCMLDGKKIYYPTFKDTLEIFSKIYTEFSHFKFTTAFLEAYANKLKLKQDIGEAKGLLSIYQNDPSLIPEQSKQWHKDYKPFEHQKMMLEWSTKLPFFANLSEMGTGKTYPTIIAIAERIKNREINKAFVIVPKSIAKSVWKEQINKYSNLTVNVIEGSIKNRMQLINEKVDIYIIGFELFAVMANEIIPMIDEDTMVVLDESSKIKNPTAKRSKAIHQLGRFCKYKIILNGTPVTQGATDIWSQYQFLDNGETFGSSFEQFLDKYFHKERYGWKWQVKNDKAFNDISNKIYNYALRYLKLECLDLPPKLYESREVVLTPEQWNAYQTMKNEMIAWIEDKEKKKQRIDASVVVVKLLRLSQITSGHSKNEYGDVVRFPVNPKLNELKTVLDDILYNGNQLVIWARFIDDIKSVSELLTERKIKHGMIYGAIKNDDRAKAVSDFLAKKIKVFIGQQGSGGLGIDLYTANNVIYFSNDYTLLNRLQSEDRTHRSGSEIHNKVKYIDLIATGPNGEATIDHHILHTVLREKKNVADIITRDGLKNFLKGGEKNG